MAMKNSKSQVKKVRHWPGSLIGSMYDEDSVVERHEDLVVIKDNYPKAKHHFLVLPVEKIPSLRNLERKHLPLLRQMEKAGRNVAAKYPESTFKIGYHALPSMSQVHLHVISDDFVSACLKTKKHFNSFVTEFFRSTEDVMKELESTGKVKLLSSDEAKAFMDTLLQCNQCSFVAKNIPLLKSHLESHLKSKMKGNKSS